MELTELCQELKNWFEVERVFGTFKISEGSISSVNLKENQYFRIIGSVFNDGVHKNSISGRAHLVDEEFEGAVWAMAVPPAVIALAEKITEWDNKYGDSVKSPYTSESFGGYSYSKSTGGTSGNGGTDSQNYKIAFADDLNKWRKV